jgi:hypothetical protein
MRREDLYFNRAARSVAAKNTPKPKKQGADKAKKQLPGPKKQKKTTPEPELKPEPEQQEEN